MNDQTLLLRQVNPSWIQSGQVTSQAFKPTPKDEQQLSVYDGDQIDARNSWLHFTNELGCESAGTLAVSVAECSAYELLVEPDPTPFPEHVIIRFDGLSGNQIEKKAKRLKACAIERGWLYEA